MPSLVVDGTHIDAFVSFCVKRHERLEAVLDHHLAFAIRRRNWKTEIRAQASEETLFRRLDAIGDRDARPLVLAYGSWRRITGRPTLACSRGNPSRIGAGLMWELPRRFLVDPPRRSATRRRRARRAVGHMWCSLNAAAHAHILQAGCASGPRTRTQRLATVPTGGVQAAAEPRDPHRSRQHRPPVLATSRWQAAAARDERVRGGVASTHSGVRGVRRLRNVGSREPGPSQNGPTSRETEAVMPRLVKPN